MIERVALDANVLDWLLLDRHLDTLLRLRACGRLAPIVMAEVAHEIDQMPPEKATQRARLQDLIEEHFRPIQPTFVPIVGLARVGLAYLATPETESFHSAALTAGLRKLDALHVTNAHFHRCVAFLTRDKRLLRKGGRIEALTSLKLENPEVRIC